MLEQTALFQTTPVKPEGTIYTVGYGNRTRKDLFNYLFQKLGANVAIIDVRQRPVSAWHNSWKNINNLQAAALEMNQDWKYKWMGKFVGNPSIKIDKKWTRRNQENYWDWIRKYKLGALRTFTNYCRTKARNGRKLVLLCACLSNALKNCHRVPLARHLATELKREVVHL